MIENESKEQGSNNPQSIESCERSTFSHVLYQTGKTFSTTLNQRRVVHGMPLLKIKPVITDYAYH